jgi:membrane-bound lytic murein transglycosylase A
MNEKFFSILLFFLILCSCAKNPQKKVLIKNNSYQVEKEEIKISSKKISKVWFKNFDFTSYKKKLIKTSWDEIPNDQKLDKNLMNLINERCLNYVHYFSQITKACDELNSLTDDKKKFFKYFKKYFSPWLIRSSNQNLGKLTGYYEPIISGSLSKSNKYKYPLFGKPEDLIIVNIDQTYPELKGKKVRGRLKNNVLIPYYTRKEIESGKHTSIQPIAWAADKVDIFFLQIQGSGKLKLPDENIIKLNYDAHNGHPYTSIGRILIKEHGLSIADVSMNKIKKWINKNPTMGNNLMERNKSFVFFKISENSEDGPTGSIGYPLTPLRSIAIDPMKNPMGFLYFINTVDPKYHKIRRFVFAEDTGSAIKGQIRFDFFWGSGNESGLSAGKTNEAVKSWVILPNSK